MATGKKRLRIGVLFGGRSGEHEVSLASAASVIRGLDPEKYEAVPIGISKDGRWLVGGGAQKMLPEVLKTGQRVVLPADPNAAGLMPLDHSGGDSLRVDVVFPVLHGTFGEDGTVQGLLELAGLPYVGAGVVGSAVGMDKDMQKRLFLQADLPVADFLAVPRADWEKAPKKALGTIEKKFRYPLFVKPATLGSSVGMTKVHMRKELPAALGLAAEFAQKILVERAIVGREIEVSVLGNADPRASVPGEIVPHREFYDYTAKYLEEGTQLIIPAKLTRAQVKRFQDYAVRAFRAIECTGMARVDFFLEGRTRRIFLNEVNTIPGFTSISMYPKLWEASGLGFRELIDRLIELALELHREKARTKYSIELPAGAGGALEA
ncbi:MAG: D-alanine--D-alanine ligase A [Acidobacteria bacterium]|nr:MAG: D-alanine--D-alanine ligase A [Acidobacteriota bacterium]